MGFLAGQILKAASLPRGLVADLTASGASSALSSTGLTRDLPSTSTTITNTSPVTKQYNASAVVQASMAGGTNGLYRALVTNGSAVALSPNFNQFLITVTGGAGQTAGRADYAFTLAPSASITLAAGGLRVSGGSATDVLAAGSLKVTDLGPS